MTEKRRESAAVVAEAAEGGSQSTRGRGDADLALIRRAAALRAKYKKNDDLTRIPVMQIGSHPDNRDGQGPSACRCLELTSKILQVGFDVVEADANGVLVEQKPGSTHIADANKRFVRGENLLAPIVDGQISYGTLSHSTLNQLMRNIVSRCPIADGSTSSVVTESSGDGDMSRIVDGMGKLSVGLLQMIDPAFAKAVQSGLLWEILSHKIEEEEPEGCAIIQSALNAKNGLFLVAHEMQALSRLMTLTSSSAVAGAGLSWEAVMGKVRETMPEFTSDKNFIDLYAFVVDLGAGKSIFLQDLKTFHQRFVNPKIRRVRLDAFAAANALPIEMPHLKVALLKYVYVASKTSHGYCVSVPIKAIKTLSANAQSRAASAVAEQILRFFHVDCIDLYKKSDDGFLTRFLGNLDKDIVCKLINSDPLAADNAVRARGADYHRRLTRAAAGAKVPKYIFGQGASTANAPGAVVAMQPKVIEYDSKGRPLSKQKEQSSETQREEFGWAKFMESSCARDSMTDTCAKTLILAHLHMLHFQLPRPTEAHLKIVKGDIRGGGVRVVAVSAMKEGALRMAPMATGPACLTRLAKETATTHLKVRVTRHGEVSEWCLTCGPPLPAPSAVAEQGSVVTQHSWKPCHFPWPLWFIKRVSHVDEANCKFEEMLARCVSTFDQNGRGEPFADNCDVVVPVLVNTKSLGVGDELRVLWAQKSVAKPADSSKITWVSQARVKLGNQHQRQK